jgi:hypothetical protein
MGISNRMVSAELEYLKHLASDGRELEARGLQALHLECTLTPGVVASHVVTVQGQVVDAFGVPVAGTFDITLETYVPTGGQGTIAAAGTPVGTVKVGSGTAKVWMQTSSTGAFAVAVTDSTSELGLIKAQLNDGLNASAEMQF